MEDEAPIEREPSTASEIPRLGRSVYERTDPDYVDRVDRRNFEIYTSLKGKSAEMFLQGLPQEEMRALNERLQWRQFVSASENSRGTTPPALLVQAVIESHGASSEGDLIQAVTVPWKMIVNHLKDDWTMAFKIPPRTWEEMVAAAFHQAGYDEVILTPRSGDHGRDVIAIRRGVGSVRIIDSVKAYKPGHLVKHDDVRALAGVLLGDHQASKGMLTTTSDFAPGIAKDPFLAPLFPYRLELMNGKALRDWLLELTE